MIRDIRGSGIGIGKTFRGSSRRMRVVIAAASALSAGALGATVLTVAATNATAKPASVTSAALTPAAVFGDSVASSLSRIQVQPAPLSSYRHVTRDQPPTTSQCQAQVEVSCYLPTQVQDAYNLPSLYSRNITGKGETIAIIDAYGSPTISGDLSEFDNETSVAAPPALQIIQPAGSVPAYDSSNADMVGWAEETTLDVEYAHTVAPGARILLVEAPSDSIADLLTAEDYVIEHGMAGVITQSFGETEQILGSHDAHALHTLFEKATRHGITVLAATGDSGATGYESNGTSFYHYPVASWPATDPLVTAVGGTELNLDASGNRAGPDSVWNDTYSMSANNLFNGSDGPSPIASGGGKSVYFSRPSYQNSVKKIVGKSRGIPDISMSASCSAAVTVYVSFAGIPAGWYPVCGTSEASPLFAGIVALTDQAAGHWLGSINPAMYKMGAKHERGITLVTSGNNTVSFSAGTSNFTVHGYYARKGYSMATGLGTVNAQYFVPELARLG
jgi:subtilase family serine protease